MVLKRLPRRRLLLLGVITAMLSVALVACGEDANGDDRDDGGANGATTATHTPAGGGTTAPTATSTGDEETLSGALTIEGSSTVAPYTRLAIEAFEGLHSGVTVTTGELGSGGGITAFINGEAPIAASSRAIRDNEVEQAAANGYEVFETVIAYDALAIVVHPSNEIPQLTFEEVARIFAGEITNWSEVGGADLRITVYTRNEESGTFAFVEEDVIQAALGSDAEYAATVNKQANAPAGLTAVSGDVSGIFYAGLGNLADIPAGAVREVPIAADAASDAVEASSETVTSGAYPVARGLFYYTDGDPAAHDDPLVRAYLAFVVSAEGQAIAEELNLVPAR
ncbi:MAG: PstS family phosphate ABC transporter substrate-binding protein [Dehalococcoidia bacterium]|nr:PstS family phosphate ABC transporter substrate-binding protein [Dehalococcoidia bacterium]